MNKPPLQVYSPSGIGDSLWVLQKIIGHTEREIHLYTWERDNISSPFLMGLKNITKVEQFKSPYNNYNDFRSDCTSKYNNIYIKMKEEDIDLYEQPFYLEANDFLEKNNHLDTYLPNFKTTYDLNWDYNDVDYNRAMEITEDKNTIVIYTSCLRYNNSLSQNVYGDWKFDYWERLIKQLFDKYIGCKVVWIGSNNDKDAGLFLKNIFHDKDFEMYVQEPATFIVPLLKNCKCFFSYQSGLSCLSIITKSLSSDNVIIPTYMYYFSHLGLLRHSICHPEVINNRNLYNPVFFKDMMYNAKDAVAWAEQHLN